MAIEDDLKRLSENPGNPASGIAAFKENLADREADLSKLKDVGRGRVDYHEAKGMYDVLKEHELEIVGAKSQVDLVYTLSKMKQAANAELDGYIRQVKKDDRQLEYSGLLHDSTRSDLKEVRLARESLMRESGRGEEQDDMLKLTELEARADYSRQLLSRERHKLDKHAESLGIANPKNAVDGVLNMKRLAETAAQARSQGMLSLEAIRNGVARAEEKHGKPSDASPPLDGQPLAAASVPRIIDVSNVRGA